MSEVLKQLLEGQKDLASRPATADAFFMDRAVQLAWQGAGRTYPNPLVGAVVVKGGAIVGEGYHPAYGLDHAEKVALDDAGSSARGATLYVTLEPCTHFGKTPPCVDAIMTSGLARVVVAALDPNPVVNGSGVQRLRDHGLEVDVGCRFDSAVLLNLPYFKRVLGLGPTLTLKMAATLDGRIASRRGRRDRISGEASQEFTHRLRATHRGVLVGIDTLLIDEPRLDCRLVVGAAPPLPIVLDTRLRFPAEYHWAAEERPFAVVTGRHVDRDKASALMRAGGSVLECASSDCGIDLVDATVRLRDEGVTSVLVEGGGRVFAAFVEQNLWDAVYLFVSPMMFGPDGVELSPRSLTCQQMNAHLAPTRTFGRDTLISYLNESIHRVLKERLGGR